MINEQYQRVQAVPLPLWWLREASRDHLLWENFEKVSPNPLFSCFFQDFHDFEGFLYLGCRPDGLHDGWLRALEAWRSHQRGRGTPLTLWYCSVIIPGVSPAIRNDPKTFRHPWGVPNVHVKKCKKNVKKCKKPVFLGQNPVKNQGFIYIKKTQNYIDLFFNDDPDYLWMACFF